LSDRATLLTADANETPAGAVGFGGGLAVLIEKMFRFPTLGSVTSAMVLPAGIG